MKFNNHAKVDNFIEITRYKENILYIVINYSSNSGDIQVKCCVPNGTPIVQKFHFLTISYPYGIKRERTLFIVIIKFLTPHHSG